MEIVNFILSKINKQNFEEKALNIFKFQAENNSIYKKYINYLKIEPEKVNNLKKIPFLPIDFFKTHKVVSGNFNEKIIFTSSGTTGMQTSKHFVANLKIYEESFVKSFTHFYGNIEDYVILALLPSYLERDGSSLVYMAEYLIKKSKKKLSGFYLNNFDDLYTTLQLLEKSKQKALLLGVSFALLDFFEKYKIPLKNIIIMETGGMKGRRKEIIRSELHNIIKKATNIENIHSEYGMTELLSQAYSQGDNLFSCPPQMKILIRDTNDPFTYLKNNKAGGINVIDLANLYSCSFIETKDLGKLNNKNKFEVLGRFDNSDVRGCNLMVI